MEGGCMYFTPSGHVLHTYACDGHEHVLHTFWAATGAGGKVSLGLGFAL